MSFSRSFRIRAPTLSRAVQLVLVFEPLDKNLLYNDQFPIAWKVIKFSAGTYGDSGPIVFKNSLAVATATVNSANIVLAGSAIDAKQGDSFSVTENGGVLTIAYSDNAGGPLISVENDTQSIQDLSFGFIQNDIFNCVQVQTAVGVGLSAVFQYTPKLKIYLTSNFQESQVVRSEIRSKPLWDKDLGGTPTTFTLNLNEAANGSYTITDAPQALVAAQTAGAAPLYRSILLAEFEQFGGNVWRFYGEAPAVYGGDQSLYGRGAVSNVKSIGYRSEVADDEYAEDADASDVLSNEDDDEDQNFGPPNVNYWAKAFYKFGAPVTAVAFSGWAFSRFRRAHISLSYQPTTGGGAEFTLDAQGASEQLISQVASEFFASKGAEVPTGNLHSQQAGGKQLKASTTKVISVEVKTNAKKK